VPIKQQLRSRQHLAIAAIPDDDSTKQQQPESAEDINSRILSGEFTDSGSTKEKMTRPIRKALAQDPIGIGKVKLHQFEQLYAALLACCGSGCSSSCVATAAAAIAPLRQFESGSGTQDEEVGFTGMGMDPGW
jgi:hypothetical protein